MSQARRYISTASDASIDRSKTKTSSTSMVAIISEIKPTSRRLAIGVAWILSIIVVLRTCFLTNKSIYEGGFKLDATTTVRGQRQSAIVSKAEGSWMDKIMFYRSSVADASHQLKSSARNRERRNDHNDVDVAKEKRISKSITKSSYESVDFMVDISVLRDAVLETVRDVGVRALLFEVLSDDFEYYMYSDESASYDSTDRNDDEASESLDQLDAYWERCASQHGVGKGCNEWDVWWTYHYAGAILTDMLLEDGEILWDGSSGETIRAPIGSGRNEGLDAIMKVLLEKIHYLQAALPYLTQASFHAEHAIIWRYVEQSSGRLSTSYPWELAKTFCRGDGSRPKGIVGRPVNKGVDHECFHGFGHAMFYAVASRQLQAEQSFPKQQQKGVESYMVLRPHSGFELSPESYCEVWELCRGASPSKDARRAMDPNDEASGNHYRICFEGVVHSVRLLSKDSPQMRDKDSAIHVVKKQMKRCEQKKEAER